MEHVVSERKRLRSIPFIAAISACVLALGVAFAWSPQVPQPTSGASEYQQNQVESVISAHGYYDVASLEKGGDGYWRAEAKKGDGRWRLELSPRGRLSANPIDSVAPQT